MQDNEYIFFIVYNYYISFEHTIHQSISSMRTFSKLKKVGLGNIDFHFFVKLIIF